MTKPLESHRSLANRIREVFGAPKPDVHRYWDDARRSSIAVVSAADVPDRGVTSYATVGLFEAPNLIEGVEAPARVELLGAAGSQFEGFANALSTAAFCVINSGWFCGPGEIFPDVFRLNGSSKALPHGLFIPPFLWGEGFRAHRIEDRTVTWLQLIGISPRERDFAESNGVSALTKRFETEQIDVYDLERDSVV